MFLLLSSCIFVPETPEEPEGAYIDQLAHVVYAGNFEEIDEFEPLDAFTGY